MVLHLIIVGIWCYITIISETKARLVYFCITLTYYLVDSITVGLGPVYSWPTLNSPPLSVLPLHPNTTQDRLVDMTTVQEVAISIQHVWGRGRGIGGGEAKPFFGKHIWLEV